MKIQNLSRASRRVTDKTSWIKTETSQNWHWQSTVQPTKRRGQTSGRKVAQTALPVQSPCQQGKCNLERCLSHETERRLSMRLEKCGGKRVGLHGSDPGSTQNSGQCTCDGGDGVADGSGGCECRRRTSKRESDRDDESVRELVTGTLPKTCCNPFHQLGDVERTTT